MAPLASLLGRRGDDKARKKSFSKAPAAAAAPVPDTPAAMCDADFAPPTREVLRPPNQLQLSEAELGEEVAKMLTANNPAAPQNLARFNMKERAYKFEPMVEQHVVHYVSDGWLLHKSSDEARKQAEQDKGEAEASARFQAEMDRAFKEKAAGLDVELPDDSRQLRNQFNFSERAAQTFSYPLRDRATFTEPAPTATASGSCSLWEIYDEYRRDFERQRQEDTSKQRPGAAKRAASTTNAAAAAAAVAAVSAASPPHASTSTSGSASSTAAGSASGKPDQQAGAADAAAQWAVDGSVLDKLRILDRMVNQNSFADVAMDFKYWDDTSDAIRPGEGSLLPLWHFACERGRKHVTSLAWSPAYADQFAVGYGSFHSQRQGGGAVSVFSLKNPSHAELTIATESGVMALAWHPEFGNLLAIGCYDGSVAVYDVAQKSGRPLYTASAKARRHSDAVWQVVWQVDELQKSLAFVSISADGDVLLWTLAKCELLPERLMRLQPPADGSSPAATAAAAAAASGGISSSAADDLLPQQQVEGGLCMDFGKLPGQEHTYLVGTESGCVHLCSTAYCSGYVASFGGHHMPVYAVKWNSMHPSMFLSCSADWFVRVWDVAQQEAPLLSFDLGAAVGDVAWAPYSSTVFAAVNEGRVVVFDVAQNRQLPLCVQKLHKKARCTRLAFNPKHPILLVGDSKGGVVALKLSPNLRKSLLPTPQAAVGSSGVAAGAAASSAGGGVAGLGAPAAGESKQASAASKLVELERQKLEAVIAVARRSQAPVLYEEAAARQ